MTPLVALKWKGSDKMKKPREVWRCRATGAWINQTPKNPEEWMLFREVVEEPILVTREMLDKVTDCNTTDEVWLKLKELSEEK